MRNKTETEWKFQSSDFRIKTYQGERGSLALRSRYKCIYGERNNRKIIIKYLSDNISANKF